MKSKKIQLQTSQRARKTNLQLKRKRGDTHIGSIEKKYGIDLGVRSDMHVSTYLKNKGYPSLSKIIKNI